jgi:two-component system, NtrC family, response regulator AtoC
MAPRVLLLDPPTRLSRDLEQALARSGLEVVRPTDLAGALAALATEGFDVALEERSLGGGAVLAAAREQVGGPPVILLDDFGSAAEAAQAVAAGAFEVLARPLPPEAVLQAVRRALEQRELQRENQALRSEVGARPTLANLSSGDPEMRRVLDLLAAVADSDATLLLSGESGVGKTMLARAVHARSGRAGRPFVEVNCGALPETLLESELFGHTKGAFTGAVRDRAGKFEAADGGTLFLDEISTASQALQVKLLRVLEDKTFEPVGDERTRRVDVRLIAASNRDLHAEVEAGRFRADLFYRIHVVAVEIPPLRARRGDVPALCEAFVKRFAERHRRPVKGLEPAAVQALAKADWPGNVRELEHTLERAVLLAPGPLLRLLDLGLAPSPAADETPWESLPLGPLKQALAIPERALILRALHHHGGSRQRTALLLDINRTTLFNKMRKYDLLSFPMSAEAAPGAPGPAGAHGE